MKRELLLPFLALLAIPLVSCLEPESVPCASGLVCPAGFRCAAKQDQCIKDNCGDGIVELGEACDDGNVSDGDGCNKTCTSDETCGNGILDLSVGERCDDGNTLNGDKCSSNCRSNEACGNHVVDSSIGEVCDDGANQDGDGCSADCLSNETCGNGIVDLAAGEVCDDGNTVDGDNCSSDCHTGPGCGNGILNSGEQCDDGNRVDGDGCTNQCFIGRCGDGITWAGMEECDTGGESGTCNANCKKPVCGDGVVNVHAGEQCDEGHLGADGKPVVVDTATCNSDCTIPRCGDGHVNEATGEQCDPGGSGSPVPKDSSTCNANCTMARCGDGYVNTARGEECDDGNGLACGTCDENCKNKPVRAAEGTLTVLDPHAIEDRETFSIQDSDEPDARVFEFNTGVRVDPGHIEVDLHSDPYDNTTEEVVNALVLAISTAPDFDISVIRTEGNVIYIRSDRPGTIGNKAMDSRLPTKFSVNGMKNGSGYDCAAGVGCRSDADCWSRECKAGRCQ